MSINRENYEQFFLDYAEGRLSPAGERELLYFLSENPDLHPLLQEFDPGLTIEKHAVIFQYKEKLKKNTRATARISAENAEEWMISSMEGLLSPEEERELEEFLVLNPSFQFDNKKYISTRLSPDPFITFPDKNKLKKKGGMIPAGWMAWSVPAAAAAVMLFLAVRFFIGQPPMQDEMGSPVAQTELPASEKPEPFNDNAVAFNNSEEIVALKETPLPIYGTPSHERISSFRMNPVPAAYVAQATANLPNGSRPEKIPGVELTAFTPKNPPLIARVVSGIFKQARNQVIENTPLDDLRKTNFDFWSLASAGIKGYNSLSDREIELHVEKDGDGKAASYALVERDNVIFHRELARD